MNTSMTLLLTGMVESDPIIRNVGEDRLVQFSVPLIRDRPSGKPQILWVRVHCWNKLADQMAQEIKKGTLVQVTADWMRMMPSVMDTETGQPSLVYVDANRIVPFR